MNIETLGKSIVDSALEFMAAKAGVTTQEIAAAVAADTEFKAAARYFANLCATAINNVDAIIAGQHVTAETIRA